LAATNEKFGDTTRIAVIANSPATSRPIQLTGLDGVVALFPTLDAALHPTDD
jgi:hypothetical protein